jgi:hypothetical protein
MEPVSTNTETLQVGQVATPTLRITLLPSKLKELQSKLEVLTDRVLFEHFGGNLDEAMKHRDEYRSLIRKILIESEPMIDSMKVTVKLGTVSASDGNPSSGEMIFDLDKGSYSISSALQALYDAMLEKLKVLAETFGRLIVLGKDVLLKLLTYAKDQVLKFLAWVLSKFSTAAKSLLEVVKFILKAAGVKGADAIESVTDLLHILKLYFEEKGVELEKYTTASWKAFGEMWNDLKVQMDKFAQDAGAALTSLLDAITVFMIEISKSY